MKKIMCITMVMASLFITVEASARGGAIRNGGGGRSAGAARGPSGGGAAAISGPNGSAAAVRGPNGGGAAAVSGPNGSAAAVRGPNGNTSSVRGANSNVSIDRDYNVDIDHNGGCYNCGYNGAVAAGVVVGAAVGAAAASTYYPSTVVVGAPVYVEPAPVDPTTLVIGTKVGGLPPGAQQFTINGVTYYQAGFTWYQPYYGNSGVYYEVVEEPR